MKYVIFTIFLFVSLSIFGQDWKASYTEALACAKKEGKPLILVFSGSDWCAPCIKLDQAIWKSEDFKDYSAKNYVLYKADFPRKHSNKLSEDLQEENNRLASLHDPEGYFPLVVVLDKDGNFLGRVGYKNITPKKYISLLNSMIR